MSNIWMVIFGMAFVFVMTTLGALVVYLFKKDISPKLNALFLGFASGIMIAASVWSLLIPSIEGAAGYGKFDWVPASVGFIVGGLFLMLLDKIVPHMHKGSSEDEGLVHKSMKKSTKLFFAMLIHNIPEGLAVGFAFGAASALGETGAYVSALGLAVGIGVQNLPEGAAVSLPMRNATGSRHKAFLYGTVSGVVEPVAAVLGYFLAAHIAVLQPWLLAFAAGAMIFVVAEDLIPDAKLTERSHLGTWGVMAGFALMMILDVAL